MSKYHYIVSIKVQLSFWFGPHTLSRAINVRSQRLALDFLYSPLRTAGTGQRLFLEELEYTMRFLSLWARPQPGPVSGLSFIRTKDIVPSRAERTRHTNCKSCICIYKTFKRTEQVLVDQILKHIKKLKKTSKTWATRTSSTNIRLNVMYIQRTSL